jgi:hypothetical protein
MIIKRLVISQSYGTKVWYRDARLHRDRDQPAVIYQNGKKFWYVDGYETLPLTHLTRKALAVIINSPRE